MTAMERLLRALGVRLGTLYGEPPRPLSEFLKFQPRVNSTSGLRVGIVTPVLNQVRYVRESIASVITQDYDAIEYVIKDGGSTDGTLEAIGSPYGSVQVLSGNDSGQAAAVNSGFKLLPDAEVMAFLNGDDLLLPGAVAEVCNFFATHRDVDVVYGHRVLIDENSAVIGSWIMPPHDGRALLWRDYIPQETLFWRRSVWDAVGAGLDEGLHFALDWDLLVRFQLAGARMVRLPRFLGAFRVHDRQKTSRLLGDVGRKEMAGIQRRTVGRSVSPIESLLRVAPYLARHALADRRFRAGAGVD